MVNLSEKKTNNEVRNQVMVSDFIPFACHYTPSTILTKNGELLKIIKITASKALAANEDLRAIIRKILIKHIPDDKYAVYFHTVRRKKDLSFKAKYPDSFSAYVDKSWKNINAWDKKYINELYISILYEGQNINLKSLKDYMRSIFYYTEKKHRNKYLKNASKKLTETVKNIVEDLKPYGARLLGMAEQNGVLYSEPQQFFGKLINLSDAKYEVDKVDLSKQLPTHRISFGFNALEVRGDSGRHFASIFSIKEYIDLSPKAFDKFIQLPMEFIITETVNFINKDLALTRFKYQHYIFSLSKDFEFEKTSGIQEIIDSEKGKPTDFGEHQITIMIIEDNLKLLEEEIDKFVEVINSLGITVIREDVMMEDCYWAQLPGNFNFSRRRSLMPSSKMGGLASLYNFPSGNSAGAAWGEAVTLLNTESRSPYFFNFHTEIGGHTLIVGPESSGKRTFINFLLAESRKFNTKIFIIDDTRKSEAFVKAMGGKYYDVSKVPMNPLLLKEGEESKKFLRAWFEYLITTEDDKMLTEVEKAKINSIVSSIFSLPASERSLQRIMPLFNTEETRRLQQKLEIWQKRGELAKIFGASEDTINLNSAVTGFNVASLLQEKRTLGPVLSYLIFKIRSALTGGPAIIVINNAWGLLDNYMFAAHLERWLEYYKQKNCVIVFLSDVIYNREKTRISSEIVKKFSTKIFFPLSKTSENLQEYYGLTAENIQKLIALSKEKYKLLIKQYGHQDVIIDMNVKNFSDIISLLSLKKEHEPVFDKALLKENEGSDAVIQEFKKNLRL